MERHDWSADCEHCLKCGAAREGKHNWRKDCEKCYVCGAIRQNSINGMAVNARSAVQVVTKGTTGTQTPRNVCGAPLSAILAPAGCAKGPAKSRVSCFVGLGRKSA